MQRLGFLGLGVMGQPMALNLLRHYRLLVWNRTTERCVALADAGAVVAASPAEVFEHVGQGGVVFAMLFDEAATDAALRRGSAGFPPMVRDRTLVNMSSVAPAYSQALARDVAEAGGAFVEAPVSGSRVPAEAGQLIAMLGGEEAICAEVRPLLEPMCRQVVYCGAVGNGMLMKLAINIFMLTSVVGLAEAFHFAKQNGLPLERFQEVADASQMASQLSRIKLAKLLASDFARQGAVIDGVNNTRLITEAAERVDAPAAVITQVRRLYDEALAMGDRTDDMIAVIRAMEARSRSRAAKD
ncbi:MAG TPA: NAD(P)-dependent oxidoreductase [Vicinamibacterales bacterium]|nr:NAD(P)-dependent oxidoreductase [Vicinamibacterales bacterium]